MIIELFFASCYACGATSEYRLEIAVLEGVGHFGPKFQVQGDIPHQPFVHGKIGQWMPYNFAAESFHTNFVADFLREMSIF